MDILCRTLVGLALQSSPSAPAAADSLLTPELDANLVTPPVDSLAAGRGDSLITVGGDSLAAALDDSLGAVADSTVGDVAPEAPAPQPPPWSQTAALRARDVVELHPGLLAEALELVPGVSLRVGGDWGAPSYLSIGPLGGPAPEILYDGVPSRSPADLDPAVWDRSAIGLLSLGVAAFDAPPGGPPRLLAETTPPLVGRTHMRTHFAKEAYESYLRGLWVTTPHAARRVHFEFEEWKTELGRNFTSNPQFDTLPNDFGRSKMRRFRAGGDVATAAGRMSLSFGRGRRLYRGTALGGEDTERWTGEIAVGLDRPGEKSYWRVRAYHLDFSDDDDTHAESRDASRLGVRVARVPTQQGWGANLHIERRSASFVSGAELRRPSPAYVARAAGSWRASLAGRTTSTMFAEGIYAENAIEHFDGAGGAALERAVGGTARWEVGAARRVRVPTLLETGGLQTADIADGSILRREGAGPLPLERQDRAHLTLAADGGRWSMSGTAESWRLTRGIGWEPGGQGAVTVGGLELTVHQVQGAASWRGGSVARGWMISAAGHHVLGPLSHARDRGTGWPLWSAQARLRVWRQVASHFNRGFVEVSVHSIGPRFDDAQAPLNGARLVTQTRLDGRVGLKIRDAELYLSWLNVLDAELVEVLGTRRRPRELRLGLVWPFFN